ncbi:MAG: HAMP domain-containing histidine kinase [Bradyrhizobiaceae bacterium]|nr:MAG: HAMP domain-containing histidine kinase [Bradyrhizobiaceae bacterium]
MLRQASLGRRLLIAAIGFIAVALVLAAVLIGFVLHRFVQGQIDQRLDTQIVFLSSMLRANPAGLLSLAGNADGPPFERVRRGWYWQITGPNNVLRSASLEGADISDAARTVRDGPPPPPAKKGRKNDSDERADRDSHPRPADGAGPGEEYLHYRIKQADVAGVPVAIVVSAPRAAVWGPLREAMTTLALSLTVLGVALVLAIMLQVRLGLRPLDRLRRSVADVRNGTIHRVPAKQPAEIEPLVSELNGLLQQNDDNLERARRHVANLAHGLKTPLATLGLAISANGGRDPALLHPLVMQMERRIRHHLGRARTAALNGPVRARTVVAPRVQDLGDVLGKIHGDKAIRFVIDVPPALTVACEAQDLDEMLGNLLENAYKWARNRVSITAMTNDQRMVALVITDDGPGLLPEQMVQVQRPGERLDETAPGFGFGLSITSELAELYGGNLALRSASPNGLCVTLTIPIAAPSDV